MTVARVAIRFLVSFVSVLVVCFAGARPADAKMRIESRQWLGPEPTSPATARSIFEGLTPGGTGYGAAEISGIVPSGTSVSGSIPGGSSSNYGVYVVGNFNVGPAQAGPWTFQWGVDFKGGGTLLIDGVSIAENWTDDMWWDGNYTTPGGTLGGTVTLSQGTHLIELFGFEDCCDGAMGARFKIGAGAFQDLNDTNLPSLLPDAPFGSPPVNGEPCMPTGDGTKGTAKTCHLGICDTSDSICGYAAGVSCSQDNVCRSGGCPADGKCGLTNGFECTRANQCRTNVCAADGRCGIPNGASCASDSACRSLTCSSGICGIGAGVSCSVAADCAGGVCGPDGKCGLSNSSACTRDIQCRSAVCNVDGNCGLTTGATCTEAASCRSGACTGGSCAAPVDSGGADSGVSTNDGGTAPSDASTSSPDGSVISTDSGSNPGNDGGSGSSNGSSSGGADAGSSPGAQSENAEGGSCSFHAGHGFGGAALLWAASALFVQRRRRRMTSRR